MASVWLVRADGGKLADEFRADNHISIGWSIAEDLSGVTDLTQRQPTQKGRVPSSTTSHSPSHRA